MTEMVTSGSMSGAGKRGDGLLGESDHERRRLPLAPPALYTTAPLLDSTARDTKLNRDVALKVLPELFAADPERLARFKREAQVLASLNHPNIAAIYGLEESDGVRALVLELVEGPTLAEVLAGVAGSSHRTGDVGRVLSDPPRRDESPGPKGPGLRTTGPGLPLDEALPIAKQICDALEAAHELGVVHRDLKPANIKVRPDGMVKVLDFGLAKALGDEVGGDSSNSPTMSLAATRGGMILGTAAYMSPEQAKGRAADKRSDLWAFGAVLYEMLTGRRAFEGEDLSDTLANVLKSEPDWNALPSDLPPAIRTVVQRCLVKERRQRIADISVAQFLLTEPGSLAAPAGMPAAAAAPLAVPLPPLWKRAIPIAAPAAIVAGALVGAAMWSLRPAIPPASIARFSFTLPEGQTFSEPGIPLVAISPDGTQMIYATNHRLYLRSLSDPEARPIQGTEITQGNGVTYPVFSPDGLSIAFWLQQTARSREFR